MEDRVVARSIFHSSLAMSEICFPFGRLDPADTRTANALQVIEDLLSEIPDRHILTPSPQVKMRGAIMAGVMARVLGYNDAQRRKALMDGMLAAQAAQEGLLILTKNVADFDRLSQLEPKLKVAFYRT
ncbi:type II toxin-antitoxin system VapC family toxin [Loktanella sp. DJP18]|uniref:type II toxin-antitoxin system VapC family toxin n=1 Tax=Loktanella sp. DJP18 TaxID=3409788 RepID=UPI003BB49D61